MFSFFFLMSVICMFIYLYCSICHFLVDMHLLFKMYLIIFASLKYYVPFKTIGVRYVSVLFG